MDIISKYLFIGIVVFLFSLSIILNYTKLKFIDLSAGALFIFLGVFYYLFQNLSIPFWCFCITSLCITFFISVITVCFIKMGINKTISGLVSLTILTIWLSPITTFPKVLNYFLQKDFLNFYTSTNNLIGLLSIILFFLLITFKCFLFKDNECSINKQPHFFFPLLISNVLLALASILFFILNSKEMNSYIFISWGKYLIIPFISTFSVLLCSKIFIGTLKNIKIKYILIFTSSLFISLLLGILKQLITRYNYNEYISYIIKENSFFISNLIIIFIFSFYLKIICKQNINILVDNEETNEIQEKRLDLVDQTTINITRKQYI